MLIPKLLFIGTASKENNLYYKAIKNIYENFGCIVDKLEIIGKEAKNCEEFKEKVLTADIIYIGGGNTKFMLSEWNRINLIKILKEAYENGIVMSGFSAGSYCWYKYNYELIEGMGVIPAINCVHYNEKSKGYANSRLGMAKQISCSSMPWNKKENEFWTDEKITLRGQWLAKEFMKF